MVFNLIRSKKTGKWLTAILGVFVFTLGVIGVVAWVTSYLSGTSQYTPEEIAQTERPELKKLENVRFHSVSNWPEGKSGQFAQSPELAELVQQGALPSVDQRLPVDPLVVHPPEQTGPYGGTWTRFAISPRDVGLFRHRIAYEGLLRFDPLGNKLFPNLAKSWEVDEQGLRFTFTLRQGVRWSDGHPFTVEDILFWYNDVLKNEKISPGIGRHLKSGDDVVQLTKIDDQTIEFTFAEPNGLFLLHMAQTTGYQLCQYPKHYLKQFHPKYTDEQALAAKVKNADYDFWYQLFSAKGSWSNPDCPRLWAWTLTKPPPARPAVFERNPYYWKIDPAGNQLPYLDKVTFEIFDVETINIKAINGEVGMQSRHLAFKNYQLFMSNAKSGGYRVLRWLDGGTGNRALCPNLNSQDPVLQDILADKRFRIALSLAIDREAINQVRYYGVGTPRQIAPPKTSVFYDPVYEQAFLKYSLETANSMLDEMGLKKNKEGIRLRPDGEPLRIQLESSNNLGSFDALQMVVNDWQKLGILCNVKIMSRNLYSQRRKALKHDIGVWKGAGVDYPVLDPRFFIPYSGSSIQAIDYVDYYQSGGKKGSTTPPAIQEAIETFWEIEKTVDLDQQIKKFSKINQINRENLWVIGLIGDVPQLFIVDQRMRNVPAVAMTSWTARTPGNTAPECYALNKEQ